MTSTPASLFRLRLLPLPHRPCALTRHPVYRYTGHCGQLLRWAIACLPAPLGVSLLKVWGQGRHGLLEHLTECAYHGSNSDACEARNFVLHFVLHLLQYTADYPLLRLWTSGRRACRGEASRSGSLDAWEVSWGASRRRVATTQAPEHIACQQCPAHHRPRVVRHLRGEVKGALHRSAARLGAADREDLVSMVYLEVSRARI